MNEAMQHIASSELTTPAFVIDVNALTSNAENARRAVGGDDTRLLFALKSFSVVAGLQELSAFVDGFAASSLNEARLARKVSCRRNQTVHVTTPGLLPDEMPALCDLADYISFNSISQWRRFKTIAAGKVNCGLRVNPQLGFVDDPRYDPCRENSKLGVPLDELRHLVGTNAQELSGITGIHFHTNCDATDLAPLLATVEHLLAEIGPIFERIAWVNLGGGYLFSQVSDTRALHDARARLRERGSYKVFVEPGAAIARSAGYLVSTVVDLFSSGDRRIAVLDTSVNHMPEVFEYQFRPDVAGVSETGPYPYLLAGSACLAGDVFGEYRFDEPLEVGMRIVFPNRGAYSLVKANMFNGINLPTIYIIDEQGGLGEVKRYDFRDFLTLCGEADAESLRRRN